MDIMTSFLDGSSSMILGYILPFVVVLGILVFVHEWGHYIVARMCGVRVETFSIGFGPKIWGFHDRSGTLWKVSAFPLGGYVKMFGDTDPASAGHSDKVGEGENTHVMTEAEKKEAFYTQKIWKRAAIVFAGPGINYLFAIILLAGLFSFYGQAVTPPVASAVVQGSPAEAAGVLPHDEILSVDGVPVGRFEDIQREVTIALDREMDVVINRNGETVTLQITPERVTSTDRTGFSSSRGRLGILGPGNAFKTSYIAAVNGVETENQAEIVAALASAMNQQATITVKGAGDATDTYIVNLDEEANEALVTANESQEAEAIEKSVLIVSNADEMKLIKHGPLAAVGAASYESYSVTVNTLEALGQMFTGARSATELGGIIRIGAIAGDMAQLGFIAFISFAALLSINLGLINLFPIPMLDGGHLLFYAVEAVKGSPLSEATQEYAFRVGFTIVIAFMAFANINDIVQLVL